MLLSLHIKNIAIIEEEEIEFAPGLNILSGETGAGKSVILGALGLAMGEKAPKGLIRDEEKDALSEAVFSVNEDQKRALAEMDIDCPDGELILSRRITPQRAQARINGENMPADKLAKAASVLIDIYGQHEQQTLLSVKNHIKLLDEYAGTQMASVLKELSEAYSAYRNLSREFEASRMDESERVREQDLLSHEISMIESAGLRPGEDEELKSEYRLLVKGDKISQSLGKSYGLLNDRVLEAVGSVLREMSGLNQEDEKLSSILDALTDAESILSDVAASCKDYLDSMDFSPARIEAVSSRIDEIDNLKRRFSKSGGLDEIMAALEEKQERLKKLSDYESYLEELKQSLEQSEKRLSDLCRRATDIRKTHAARLSAQVEEALLDLNFEGASVEIRVDALESPVSTGMDSVCIYISTNPGEKIRPLNEIASGGELSRIMLALKTIFAESGDIDTLVFDEIDSGVSGRTAARVAQRLGTLSTGSQIICITHLPQIAARASHHFLIEKTASEAGTLSSIRPLNSEEHIREIARMLAGDDISEAAIENAKALMGM